MSAKKILAFTASITLLLSSAFCNVSVTAETDDGKIARIPGDCNRDGVVNSADILTVKGYMTGSNALISFVNSDMNLDGHINIADLCLAESVLLNGYKETIKNASVPDSYNESLFYTSLYDDVIAAYSYLDNYSDCSVESYIPIADFLFSELDKGTVEVGEKIEKETFAELAGEDSDIYKNSATSYTYSKTLKASDFYCLDSLSEIVSEDNMLYQYLSDEDLFNESHKYLLQSINEIINREDVNPGSLLTDAGKENINAMFKSYDFYYAVFLDDDSLMIYNGWSCLCVDAVKGLVYTRNNKQFEEHTVINVPESLHFGNNNMWIDNKEPGYDNIYNWSWDI